MITKQIIVTAIAVLAPLAAGGRLLELAADDAAATPSQAAETDATLQAGESELPAEESPVDPIPPEGEVSVQVDPVERPSDDSGEESPEETTPSPLDPSKRVLTIEEAQEIALRDNPSLQAAEARVEQAKQRVRQAQALWFPFVDLAGSASKAYLSERDYSDLKQAVSQPFLDAFATSTQGRWSGAIASYFNTLNTLLQGGALTGPPVPIGSGMLGLTRDAYVFGLQGARARSQVDDSFNDYRLSVGASWIVFNGFERKFTVAEAKFGAKETEASYREAQRLLMSAVAFAFYAAELGRENIAIAEADEAFNMRQLVEARARREKGTGSKSDVLNFEVQINRARAALIQSHQDYHTALVALAELLAFDGSAFPDDMVLAELDSESIMDLEAPERDSMVARAMTARPDLEQSEFALERVGATVGRRRAPFYPSVTAFASKDAARSDGYDFREDDFSTTIGIDVRYNLFAGGGNVARLKEAKAARVEAERNLASTELLVASEVLQSIEELIGAQKQLALQRANAVFVIEKRDLVEKEYAAGVAPLVRLNEAQRDLIAAQGNLALARVQLRLAWHNLRTATAETLVLYTAADDAADEAEESDESNELPATE